MGRYYKDGTLRPGKRETPKPAPAQLLRERTALVTLAGSVKIIDAPEGWPNEVTVAGDRYGKALFTPTKGGKVRMIYTRLYPLPLIVQDKLHRALEYDDAHR